MDLLSKGYVNLGKKEKDVIVIIQKRLFNER